MNLSAAATDTQLADHTGHLLLTGAFVLASLGGIALVEAFQRRRRAGLVAPTLLSLTVSLAGAASAGIHGAVMPSHWREAALYGVFFLVAGTAQLTGSVLVLLRPARPFLTANALLNIGLLLVWLQSRTVGVPLGPDRGFPERLGLLDVTSSLMELAAVLGTLTLLNRLATRRVDRPHVFSSYGAPAQPR